MSLDMLLLQTFTGTTICLERKEDPNLSPSTILGPLKLGPFTGVYD